MLLHFFPGRSAPMFHQKVAYLLHHLKKKRLLRYVWRYKPFSLVKCWFFLNKQLFKFWFENNNIIFLDLLTINKSYQFFVLMHFSTLFLSKKVKVIKFKIKDFFFINQIKHLFLLLKTKFDILLDESLKTHSWYFMFVVNLQ